MAKIIGTSGAWKSICLELNRVNLKLEKPADLHGFLEAAQKEYTLAKSKATQDVQNKIDGAKKEIEQHEKNFESDIQEYRDKISADIKLIQLAIQLLQDKASLIRKIINYFKIREHKKKIQALKTNYENHPKLLRQKIDYKKRDLEKTQTDFDYIVESQCQVISSKVKSLEKVLKSPDLAGGIAELELIDNLKTLPDNFYIINDAKLEVARAIHFDGEWLRSAQIDHVVVTPSGIFVIEVKNWSENFSKEGNYFDPYQQVKRSSYLCYILIGERYNLKTRSIIAYKGSIPKKPPESYAKVLHISEVRGYISWFKEPNASNQVVEMAAMEFVNRYF